MKNCVRKHVSALLEKPNLFRPAITKSRTAMYGNTEETKMQSFGHRIKNELQA